MANQDPSHKSLDSVLTSSLAMSQCVRARMLLYYPGASFNLQIGIAAYRLFSILNSLSGNNQRAFADRILGKEGLMPGKQIGDLANALRLVAENGLDVTSKISCRLAHPRAVTIALMGDVGALFTDTGATTGVTRSPNDTDKLRLDLREILSEQGLSPPTLDVIRRVKDTGGTKKVGPSKSKERTREENKPKRTGIHDYGATADEWMRIPESIRIGSASWQLALISSDFVRLSREPLVGHMSASPSEILQCWDMLCGWEGDKQYTKPSIKKTQLNNGRFRFGIEHSDARHARAAGAVAMLQGVGFHSSLECLEGILFYLGQDISVWYNPWKKEEPKSNRPDVGYNNTREIDGNPVLDASLIFAHGAATDLIGELLLGEANQNQTQLLQAACKQATRDFRWGLE